MSQNLPAPCFQVYAANTLANLSFRKANLATRGLIYTMLAECWVNHELPSKHSDLAKVLGLDVKEVADALPAAMAFFSIEGDSIFSPQLEDYRKHLNEIRAKQKAGGKKGADITNSKKGRPDNHADIDLDGNAATPQVEARVSSIVKQSTVNQSQTQPLEKGSTTNTWLADYERNEYAKASRGI